MIKILDKDVSIGYPNRDNYHSYHNTYILSSLALGTITYILFNLIFKTIKKIFFSIFRTIKLLKAL